MFTKDINKSHYHCYGLESKPSKTSCVCFQQQPRPPNYTHQGPIKTSSSMGGSSDGLGVVGTGRSESRTSAATATAKSKLRLKRERSI